jgi:hypothetical protein
MKRRASKPGAKQMLECKGKFFGSLSPFWLLFGLAKSDNVLFGYFFGNEKSNKVRGERMVSRYV